MHDRHIGRRSFRQQTLYSLRNSNIMDLPAYVGTEGGYEQECAVESSRNLD